MEVEEHGLSLRCNNEDCSGLLTLTGFCVGQNYAHFSFRCVKCGVEYKAPHDLVGFFYDRDWYERQDKCCRCKSAANHTVFSGGEKRLLCCKHYVEEGGPPADWHSGCMAAYKRRLEVKCKNCGKRFQRIEDQHFDGTAVCPSCKTVHNFRYNEKLRYYVIVEDLNDIIS